MRNGNIQFRYKFGYFYFLGLGTFPKIPNL